MPTEEEIIKEVLKFDPMRKKQTEADDAIIKEVLKYDPGPIGGTYQPKASPVPGGESADVDMGWKDAFSQALGNIPSSALETGKSMVQPILHPIQTGKAIGRMTAGAAQKLVPGEQEYEKDLDAVIDFFKSRYGSVENFKQSVAKDPVGILADIATLTTGAGAAVRGIGTAGKIGQISKAGQAITKAGAAMEPLNVARRIGALPLKLMPENVPSRLYRSGAKFSTTLPRQQRLKLAETALDNEIMPTVHGLDNLRNKIDGLNSEIVGLIDNATTSGQQIPLDRLFAQFDDLKQDVLKHSGEPMKSVKSIQSVENEIRKANEILGRSSLTAKEAQKLKQRIYKELQSQYSKIKHRPASVEAQMAVARSAKEALEEIIPEIKQLNATEGALIDLQTHIERASARITNRDLLGIGMPIKGTMGGVVGGYPGATAGLALGLLDTPIVKSKIAIVLNRLKKQGIKVVPSAAIGRLTAVKAGEVKKALTQESNLQE